MCPSELKLSQGWQGDTETSQPLSPKKKKNQKTEKVMVTREAATSLFNFLGAEVLPFCVF